jgi:hypothetical protein
MHAGTAVIKASGCMISTTELLIVNTKSSKKAFEMVNSLSNFKETIANLDTVLDDISVGHAVSLSSQTTFLSSFLESSKVEAVDLGKASTKLKKFKTVDFINNYTLFDFDMDLPLGMSNAVTGAYIAITLIMFAISFLCCCTCKCFRKAVFAVLKAIGIAIWDLLCWLVSCAWETIR